MTVQELINELLMFDKNAQVKINALGLQHSIDYLDTDEGLNDIDNVVIEITRMSDDI